MESIKGTFELVGRAYQGLSTEDRVTLVVAIISLSGVLINIFSTNYFSKKINKNNNELQEKLNQKNIDANLKSKARIEWIQNVRKTSSELISIYYRLLNSTDKNTLLENFFTAQEKNELLILFFGPEKQNQEMKQQIDIKSEESNKGKNDLIVNFLDNLNKGFYTYCNNVLKNEKSNLEKIRDDRFKEMLNHLIGYEEPEIIDLDDNIFYHQEPIFDPYYEKKFMEIEEQIRENVNLTSNLNERLIELRDIIRIYLKIEWNKSKNGE